METVHYLRALRRSWLLIVITLLAGGIGGFAVYENTTPMYRSTVRLIVSGASSATTDEVTLRLLSAQRALALSRIATTPPALADAQAAAGRSGGAMTVTSAASGTDPFVSITVSDRDPARAQAVAAAFEKVLPETEARLEGATAQPIKLAAVSPASLPTKPYSPKLLPDLLLGLAVGLALGVGIALVREALNKTVRDTDELEKVTDLVVLGTVPSDLPKRLLPARTNPRSARAEAYRQIRTTLLNTAGSSSPVRIVAVTSASLGEGKTSVATNVAAVFARAGHRVALVDADLRRPRVDVFLDVKSNIGLSEVLAGTATLEQALTILDDGRLAVLTAGVIPANPSEALGGLGMEAVIAQLADEYEFVFIDTPPVLPVTDALVLAPKVDGVVMVVKLGQTTRERVKQALANIDRVNATVLGVVPNHANKGKDSDYRYPYSYEAAYKHGRPPTDISADAFQRAPRPLSHRRRAGRARRDDPDGLFATGSTSATGSYRGAADA